jgi:hypothetical protein
VRTRGAGTRAAEVELGGHEPLARSPRFEVSPSPSCPLRFQPQHLIVASSCGEIEDHWPVENKHRHMGQVICSKAAVALTPNTGRN